MSSGPESALERDQRLVAAANTGDVSAFEELYRLYRDWVFGLALRHVRHRADAEDVLQETFSYLVSKPPGLYLAGRMTTFLYPVVVHLASRARERRARFREPGEALDTLTSRPEPRSGERAELATVLAGLPEAQREVLLMRTVDGLSIAEIAEALEVPEGTVKSRLHHALQWLREDDRTRSYFES